MESFHSKPDYQVINGIVMGNKIQCAHILVEKHRIKHNYAEISRYKQNLNIGTYQ